MASIISLFFYMFNWLKPKGSATEAPITPKPVRKGMKSYKEELASVQKETEGMEVPHKQERPKNQPNKMDARMRALENKLEDISSRIPTIEQQLKTAIDSLYDVPKDQVEETIKKMNHLEEMLQQLIDERRQAEKEVVAVTKEEIAAEGGAVMSPSESSREVKVGPRGMGVNPEGLSELPGIFTDLKKALTEAKRNIREGNAANAAIQLEASEKNEEQLAKELRGLHDTIFFRAIDDAVRGKLPKGMKIDSVDDLLDAKVLKQVATILNKTVGYNVAKYRDDVNRFFAVRKELEALQESNHQITEMLKEAKEKADTLLTPGEMSAAARSVLSRRQSAGQITHTGISGSSSHMGRRGVMEVGGLPAKEAPSATAKEMMQPLSKKTQSFIQRLGKLLQQTEKNPNMLDGMPVMAPSEAGEASLKTQLDALKDELGSFDYLVEASAEARKERTNINNLLLSGDALLEELVNRQTDFLKNKNVARVARVGLRGGSRLAERGGVGVGAGAGRAFEGGLVKDLKEAVAGMGSTRKVEEALASSRREEERKEQEAANVENRLTEFMKNLQDINANIHVNSPEGLSYKEQENTESELKALREQFNKLAMGPTSEIGQRIERKFSATNILLEDFRDLLKIRDYRRDESARISEALEFFGREKATKLWELVSHKFETMQARARTDASAKTDLKELRDMMDNASDPATEYVLRFADEKEGTPNALGITIQDLNGAFGINQGEIDEILNPPKAIPLTRKKKTNGGK